MSSCTFSKTLLHFIWRTMSEIVVTAIEWIHLKRLSSMPSIALEISHFSEDCHIYFFVHVPLHFADVSNVLRFYWRPFHCLWISGVFFASYLGSSEQIPPPLFFFFFSGKCNAPGALIKGNTVIIIYELLPYKMVAAIPFIAKSMRNQIIGLSTFFFFFFEKL